ncbi:hypothetical protein APSETT444_005937 [Aspergillus pseudonomiae]
MSLSLDRLSSVHGAALDGRAASVRFQQSQLIALHAKLQHLQAEACEAIVYDRGVTTAEAEIECATTILTPGNGDIGQWELKDKDIVYYNFSEKSYNTENV